MAENGSSSSLYTAVDLGRAGTVRSMFELFSIPPDYAFADGQTPLIMTLRKIDELQDIADLAKFLLDYGVPTDVVDPFMKVTAMDMIRKLSPELQQMLLGAKND